MSRVDSGPMLRVGSRGSRLARWQAHQIAAALSAQGVQSVERVVATLGDRETETPLPALGARGVFTDALEAALLGGEIDLAVHSLKDLPVDPTPGLVQAAICRRADPRDALVSASGWTLDTLPPGARVGTCSLRRNAQVRGRRPDLRLLPLRGNVDTRVRLALAGRYDAIVVAAAGLERLGLQAKVTELFDPAVLLPAPGQGALAVQCRESDRRTVEMVAVLDEASVRAETAAERAFLAGLGGGCTAPIAALGKVGEGRVHLRGFVGSADGRRRVEVQGCAEERAAIALGARLADDALHLGAAELLR